MTDSERFERPQNTAFKAFSQFCLQIDTSFLIKSIFPQLLGMFYMEIIQMTLWRRLVLETCSGIDPDIWGGSYCFWGQWQWFFCTYCRLKMLEPWTITVGNPWYPPQICSYTSKGELSRKQNFGSPCSAFEENDAILYSQSFLLCITGCPAVALSHPCCCAWYVGGLSSWMNRPVWAVPLPLFSISFDNKLFTIEMSWRISAVSYNSFCLNQPHCLCGFFRLR